MDIQEVAKRAKVSTATVSRVLNGSTAVREATTAHVRRVIEELNYVPNRNARNLRIGRTRLFGLIVSDINNPYFPELIDAFEELATQQGIEVLFTHTNYDPERFRNAIRRMVDRNVDGIAVMTSEVDESGLHQATMARVPFVLLNQRDLEARYPNVPVEYDAGLAEALEHLWLLGHRRLAFLAGPERLSSAARRLAAFCRAKQAYAFESRPEWTMHCAMRTDGGEAATSVLLQAKRRPTAIICSNDLMAIGALQAARRAGVSVPQELSIVGFDDLPVANMVMPALTTIRLPRRQIAAKAFAALVRSVAGEPRSAEVAVVPHLVVRESTAPRSRRLL